MNNPANDDKQPEHVVLCRLHRKDRPAVRRIWDTEYGFYEANEDELNAACAESDNNYTQGFVAKDKSTNEIIGFGIVYATNPESASEYFSGILDREFPDWTVVLHIGCVRSDWQGYGIGTQLFNKRLKWGKRNEANEFVGISWLRDQEKQAGSEILFEKFGFERLATVEHYYERFFDDSYCPDCGEPCTCSAAFYRRNEE